MTQKNKNVLYSLAFMMLSLLFSQALYAQISQGGTPPSFILKNFSPPVFHNVAPPSADELRQVPKSIEIEEAARLLPVNLNSQNAGTWTTFSDGSKMWRLAIKVEKAQATALYYNKFWLPENGKLYIYSPDKIQVLGAFTASNNPASGLFATSIIKGEEMILEYFEPAGSTYPAIIEISDVAFFYSQVSLSVENNFRKDFGDSENCMINVNCVEGNNWQVQKRAVARVFLRIGNSAGWCSGALVNNTAQDCKPLFLLADHCGTGSTVANRNQWVFYFNYEAPGCTNPNSQGSLASQTMTGATMLANTDGGINTGSDFLLLQLNNAVPASYNPYYAGWFRTNQGSPSGVGIHHPAGDIKKISTYTNTLQTTTDDNGLPTFWAISWATTTNGRGIIEGGSSGSPLFNNNGLIVGIASAASVGLSCTNSAGFQTIYGKFSYGWESNGTTANRRLRNWLDPVGTNPASLQGQSACGLQNVNADFTANTTSIFAGQGINFTDLSTGAPVTWNWTFQGGSPPSASAKNPTNIVYNAPGVYTVTLVASNGGFSDTETKTAYITVLPSQGTVGCDTLFNVNATDTPALFTSTVGYVSGHNNFRDVAKADFFTGSAGATISQVQLFFGVAKSNSSTRTFNVRIWDADGPNGSPGTTLGTTTVTYAAAAADVANTNITLANFSTPVTINGSFYAGIEYAYQAGDTLALITNQDGESVPTTAWEKQSSNTWFSYNNGTNATWQLDVSHFIFPVLCSSASSAPPIADFNNSAVNICMGSGVNFADISTGSPTSYSWSFPGGTPSTSTSPNPTVIYNTPGTFNVVLTVSNANGSNTKTVNSLVVVGARPTLSLNASNATCGNNGNINLTVNGGQAPLTYIWSNGASTQNISNLPSGNYSVTVSGANGCSASASTSIAALGLNVSGNVNDVTQCFDNNNGSISLVITNGQPPFSFNWSNGASSSIVSGLPGGNYTVTVTSNSCSVVNTFAVVSPPEIIANVTVTASSGGNSGGASVSATGGIPPYNYFWSNGISGASSINNLAAGSYSVSITDANGCLKEENFVVDLSTGVADNSIDKLIFVHPNPSSGIFNLQFDFAENENLQIEVYDLLGSKIFQATNTIERPTTMRIDLSELPNSTYILKVYSNKWNYYKKLLKINSFTQP